MHLSHEIQQKCYIFRIYHSWPVPVFMRFPDALEENKTNENSHKNKNAQMNDPWKGQKEYARAAQ